MKHVVSHASLCPLSWSGTTVWSNGNHWKFWKGIILAQEMLTPATAFGGPKAPSLHVAFKSITVHCIVLLHTEWIFLDVVDFMMLRVSYMMVCLFICSHIMAQSTTPLYRLRVPGSRNCLIFGCLVFAATRSTS